MGVMVTAVLVLIDFSFDCFFTITLRLPIGHLVTTLLMDPRTYSYVFTLNSWVIL